MRLWKVGLIAAIFAVLASPAIAQTCVATTAAPSWSNTTSHQISCDLLGNQRVLTTPVGPTPVASNGFADTNVTSAPASSLIAKGTPGNFYGANLVTGAASGYFLLFDAISAPADGAVLPVRCWSTTANSTLGVGFPIPLALTTGITLVFSTTGCFTKTASATAFMQADVK